MTAVEGILRQIGPAVLLPIPAGEKGPKITGWQNLTRDDMCAEYLASLNHGGNIGVLLGRPSEGLCTIDCDDDQSLAAFLEPNPDFRESLISRGARGGNVWLRIKGDYPPPAKLSLDGKPWGEWRADRNQTVFHGRHPTGRDYRNNGKRPLTIAFDVIRWPEGLSLPWEVEILPPPGPVEDVVIPESTDLGRARRFVGRFGADLRHVYEWNRWLVFENRRWNSDGNGATHRLAGELCKEYVSDALKVHGRDERQSAMQTALAWGSVRTVDNMLDAARSDLRVIVKPEQLDADPWIVGARNGACDLRTGEIKEHSRDQLVTRFMGADFNAGADCPRWEQFIEEIFPDEHVRRFVWKAAGYSLTGHTTEHHFVFLHGRGANGKSTFLEILCAAFGDYTGRAGSRLLYAIDHHGAPDDQIAELFGRRLVIANETQEGARLNEGTLKDITGGDTLRGCRKYEHGFSFKSTAKIWLAGNHKPAIRGTDDGIWRRVRLIPFERQFGPDERDENLRGKLMDELPGILNWLVQGCLLWQHEGLRPPEAVRAAVDKYRSDEDTLAEFIQDCTRDDRDSNTAHSLLFESYKHWAAATGVKFPLSSKLLGKRLRERGWRDMRTAESKCVWRCVALEQ